MPFMTDEATDEPKRSDPKITERTAEKYRQDVISELEAENNRLRERTDTLERSLNERTSELRAFGIAALAVQGARRVVHQPTLLARVPGAALRAVRGGAPGPADKPSVGPIPPAVRRLTGSGSSSRIGLPRDPSTLKVALVADEPLALALGPECQTIRLTPEGWKSALAARRPDLLLVESAWRGSAGAWQYRIPWYGHPTSIGLVDLRALTAWCASNGVPSVFWETAGPVGRGRFDEAASLFDVILTTDPAALAYYDALPTRRAGIVDLLEPGIQFRRHHPGSAEHRRAGRSSAQDGSRPPGGAVFVGFYDRVRPLGDREALDRLLDAGLNHGLVIHDTAGVAGPDAPGFPERFRAVIAPFVGTEGLPDVLRNAAVVLVDAPGGDAEVLPPAVLEALACGTPVVSTPNRAIRALFGDHVPGAAQTDDPAAALDTILADLAAARRRIRRSVLPGLVRDYRIGARLGRLATAAQIGTLPAATTIAVAVLHDEPSRTAALIDALTALGDASEFLIGTTDWDGAGSVLAESLRAARPLVPVRLVEQTGETTTARRLERLAGATDVDWIAPWSDPATQDSGPDDREPVPDPLEALVLATVFQHGDRVSGADARLPLAVRRRSVVADGWAANSGVKRVAIGGSTG
jgi:glycosyltransferase involved in cell wall biosynthesis